MKIYLASGYSVMNTKGRERYFADKLKVYRRLISFHDLSRGNKIMNVINLNKKK